MPTVAEQLRAGREQLKLSVSEAAEITKIRSDHIRALEEGNYKVFAAPVYIRGFTRTYAKMLRLNAPDLLKQLETELGEKFQDSSMHSRREKQTSLDWLMLQLSKVHWRVILPLLGIAVILTIGTMIYRSWLNYRSKDPLSALGPGLYRGGPTNAGETLPVPAPAPRGP